MLAVAIYFLINMDKMINDHSHEYNPLRIFYTETEMNDFNITLETHNTSLNFVFGLTGGMMSTGEVDILNNPYVTWKAWSRTGGRVFYDSYDLEICSTDHLMKFLPEHALGWYD